MNSIESPERQAGAGAPHFFRKNAPTSAIVLFACLLIFILLLWSSTFAAIGFTLRHDSLFIPIFLAGYFLILARLPPRLATTGLMFLSTSLCGMILSGIWAKGVSDHSIMVGLYPYSDANGYLAGGLRLLHGDELDGVSARRPLTSGLWSILLFLTHGNFKYALASMLFLSAISLVLPVRELVRTHGWTAGYMMFLAIFLFYRRFIGTTLSENLGLMLGCIGFAFIWRSVWINRKPLLLAGTLILTLALNTRAGAFFILPSLAVWAGFAWRQSTRFSIKSFTLVLIAILGGFSLNYLVIRNISQPGSYQGNFSYVAYGLVYGGDWTLVYKQHPEIGDLPTVTEKYKTIYSLVLKRLEDKPSSLIFGILRAYRDFFISPNGPYSFVNFALYRPTQHKHAKTSLKELASTRDLPSIFQVLMHDKWHYLQILTTLLTFVFLSLLALTGVILLIRLRTSGAHLMILSGLGILASVPFAPPWDADLMRVYAATIPFMIAFPAIGIAGIMSFLRKEHTSQPNCQPKYPDDGNYLVVPVLLAILAMCLSPILLKLFAPERDINHYTSQYQRLKTIRGSIITLNYGESQSSWSTRVDLNEVRKNLAIHSSGYPATTAEIESFSPGDSLVMCYNEQAGLLVFLVMNKPELDQYGSTTFSAPIKTLLPDNNKGIWRKIDSDVN